MKNLTYKGELFRGILNDGVFNKEFEFREITGEDEEAVSRSDVRTSPGKLYRVLLSRVLVSLGGVDRHSVSKDEWEKLVNSLTAADQDCIMVAVRAESLGSELEFTNKCPKCGADHKTLLEISELEIKDCLLGEEDTIAFSLPKGVYSKERDQVLKEGRLRIPNGSDREVIIPLIRNNPAQATTTLLARCVVDLEGSPATPTLVRKMTSKDRAYLEELINKYSSFGYDFTFNIDCNCGNSFKAQLNVTNFI